ncbi:hypothetical protein [Pseudooceanicola onchidii]|uniref:hypothetical protein n=1 Tax=Pseudooceanicola onchidii TaxID=2562279 RepID=UPI0010AB45D7|nr:hypothetical protein [Pseudooceanicola onchidii]
MIKETEQKQWIKVRKWIAPTVVAAAVFGVLLAVQTLSTVAAILTALAIVVFGIILLTSL